MLMIIAESVNGIPFGGPVKVMDRKGSSRYHTPYSVLETNRKFYDIFCRKNKKPLLTELPRRDQLLTYLWAAKSNFIFHGRREAVTEVKCNYYVKYDLVVDADISIKLDLDEPRVYVVKNALSKTLEEVDAALNVKKSSTLGQMVQDTIARLMFQHIRIELQYMICNMTYAVGDSVMFSHKQYDGRFVRVYDDPDPDEEDMENRRRCAGALRRFHEEMHAFIPAHVVLNSDFESLSKYSDTKDDKNLANDKSVDADNDDAVKSEQAVDEPASVACNSDVERAAESRQTEDLPFTKAIEEVITTVVRSVSNDTGTVNADRKQVSDESGVKRQLHETSVTDSSSVSNTMTLKDDSDVVFKIPDNPGVSFFDKLKEKNDKRSHVGNNPNSQSKNFRGEASASSAEKCFKRIKRWPEKCHCKNPYQVDVERDGIFFRHDEYYRDKLDANDRAMSMSTEALDQPHFHYWLQLSKGSIKSYVCDDRREGRPPLYSGFVVSGTPMDQRTLDTVYSRYTLVQRKLLRKPSKTYTVYKRYKKTDLYTLTDNEYRPIEDPGKGYIYVPHIYEAYVYDLRNFYTKFLWSPFCVKGRFKHKWDGSFDIEEMRAPNSERTYIYGMIESRLNDFG